MESSARKIGAIQSEQFQGLKTFVTINSYPSTGLCIWIRGKVAWILQTARRIEPDIAASANSPESLIGLVAAGRGIFVGPELTIRGREEIWRSVGDYNLLTAPGSFFELFAIWKKQSQLEPTISKFIDVLVAELKSP